MSIRFPRLANDQQETDAPMVARHDRMESSPALHLQEQEQPCGDRTNPNHQYSESVSSEDVRHLRRVLKDKPRHVRSMARLAVLLHHHNNKKYSAAASSSSLFSEATADSILDGKSSSPPHSSNLLNEPERATGASNASLDSRERGVDQDEAVMLALRAIKCRPDLPYGHWALSIVAEDHLDRMRHLRRASETCQGAPHVLALARLLVEPRHHEASTIRLQGNHQTGNCTTIGSASDEHPSRRPLSTAEEELYQKWNRRLQALYNAVDESSTSESSGPSPSLSWKELQSVVEREYSVGMMFRKMVPAHRYLDRCVRHLKSCSQRLPRQDHPKKALARFWLSAIRSVGSTTEGVDPCEDAPSSNLSVTRCPPEYVVGLYSTFASRFDSLLVDKLSYRTPALLRELVDAVVGPRSYRNGLDLGCGTGLSGRAFRDCVPNRLRGVDLSPDMIDTARSNRPEAYDELVVGDVTAPSTYEASRADGDLTSGATTWELIYACDVFVYLGDLSPVFAFVSEHLDQDVGVFAFSTELLPEESESGTGLAQPPPVSYRLQSTGRFAHSVSHLHELAKRHKLRVRASTICPIRKNAGRDIVGSILVLSKA